MTLKYVENIINAFNFHHGGPNHIETSPLICRANQWTGFCMIGTSVIKELKSMSIKTIKNYE